MQSNAQNLEPELIELARDWFISYCHLLPEFKENWHHQLMASYLQRIADGESLRLIISMPPRHGKSFFVNQLFPTYYFGKNPSKKIIATSYGASLAQGFGNWIKNHMMTEEYQSIFNVNVDKSSKSKKEFLISGYGGEYFAVGFGGSITGRGADLLLIDDPHKNHKEAESFTRRQSVIDYYTQTLRSRLMPDASVILIQTRWHEEDLAGYILANNHEGFEYLKIPAIQDDGAPLWKERYPIDELRAIKKTMGSMAFQGQYQQSPMKQEGNLLKKEWIQYWENLPNQFDREIITVDTTFKGNPDSDYNVLQHWGKKQKNRYLTDQIRGKFDFTELVAQIKSFASRHPRATIYIEDSANASAVLSVLQKKFSNLKLWKPIGSKEHRVNAVTPQYERMEVWLSKAYPETVDEMMIFPNGKNDDTVDAMTMALLILDSSSSGVFATTPSRLERRGARRF